MTTASRLIEALKVRGWTIAVAESLTGGLVASSLVDVPGASAVLRGAVVAYATDVKNTVLGVDAALLASRGAVDPLVAHQMAVGVRSVLRADVGIATTGVAGPEPQGGKPVGTVCIAITTPLGEYTTTLRLDGDRGSIRRASVEAVLESCLQVLGNNECFASVTFGDSHPFPSPRD